MTALLSNSTVRRPVKSAGQSWRDAADGRAFSGLCGWPESASLPAVWSRKSINFSSSFVTTQKRQKVTTNEKIGLALVAQGQR
jgi:hypothetical protein